MDFFNINNKKIDKQNIFEKSKNNNVLMREKKRFSEDLFLLYNNNQSQIFHT